MCLFIRLSILPYVFRGKGFRSAIRKAARKALSQSSPQSLIVNDRIYRLVRWISYKHSKPEHIIKLLMNSIHIYIHIHIFISAALRNNYRRALFINYDLIINYLLVRQRRNETPKRKCHMYIYIYIYIFVYIYTYINKSA